MCWSRTTTLTSPPSQKTWAMSTSFAVREPWRPAGWPGLKIFVVLSILFSVLAGRGPLPVAIAQTQTANDSAVDKWLHELYSAFGIGPGGSRTLGPTSTATSTASMLSPSQTKTPSQGQGAGGSREAHGTGPDGLASSANGTANGSGGRDRGRAVFANFVVRNAEKYTVDCWIEGIKLAASAGFDALALSVGSEPWESGQVANAFCAASKFNTANQTAAATAASPSAFKLFLSFNMTSLPCSSGRDASALQEYIRTYANHTDYFWYNGGMLVSAFAGEGCRFGEGSLDEGWKRALRSKSANSSESAIPDVWFVPAFFGPPDTLSNSTAIDGLFNWNAAWPSRGYPAAFHADRSYISALGSKTYMAAVSLWSWTQRDGSKNDTACGTEGRSFGDRWESLIKNRANVSLVEVVTWGDDLGGLVVGPSGGPFSPSQGGNSSEPHSHPRSESVSGQKLEQAGKGVLEQLAPLMKYYIEAFKSGSYPSVARDEVFLWVEAHPRKGNCSGSKQGSGPRGREWIQDRISAYALLSAPGNATLTCGPSSNSTAVPCGLSKLALALHGSECCKADTTLACNSKISTTVEQREQVDMSWVQKWVPLPGDWESDEDLTVLVPVLVA
ncbi:glycosyl hydrolase family 71-domain-containing protein [Ganoderma leucocontextum]|nr:glycosyl hydrolase family 71-domain-containing protein [Ganoderma leucocontextum]